MNVLNGADRSLLRKYLAADVERRLLGVGEGAIVTLALDAGLQDLLAI